MVGRTTKTMSNIKCKTFDLAQPTAMHAQAGYTQIVCFGFRSPSLGIALTLCIYTFTFFLQSPVGCRTNGGLGKDHVENKKAD